MLSRQISWDVVRGHKVKLTHEIIARDVTCKVHQHGAIAVKHGVFGWRKHYLVLVGSDDTFVSLPKGPTDDMKAPSADGDVLPEPNYAQTIGHYRLIFFASHSCDEVLVDESIPLIDGICLSKHYEVSPERLQQTPISSGSKHTFDFPRQLAILDSNRGDDFDETKDEDADEDELGWEVLPSPYLNLAETEAKHDLSLHQRHLTRARSMSALKRALSDSNIDLLSEEDTLQSTLGYKFVLHCTHRSLWFRVSRKGGLEGGKRLMQRWMSMFERTLQYNRRVTRQGLAAVRAHVVEEVEPLMQGWLMKKNKRTNVWKNKYYKIDPENAVLSKYDIPQDTHLTGDEAPIDTYPLAGATVLNVDPFQPDRPSAFLLCSPQFRSLHVYAPDVDKKQRWVSTLNMAIRVAQVRAARAETHAYWTDYAMKYLQSRIPVVASPQATRGALRHKAGVQMAARFPDSARFNMAWSHLTSQKQTSPATDFMLWKAFSSFEDPGNRDLHSLGQHMLEQFEQAHPQWRNTAFDFFHAFIPVIGDLNITPKHVTTAQVEAKLRHMLQEDMKLFLSNADVLKLKRVLLCLAYNNIDIHYCPSVVYLTAQMVPYVPVDDLVAFCQYLLKSSRGKHFTFLVTKPEKLISTYFVFRTMLQREVPGIAELLDGLEVNVAERQDESWVELTKVKSDTASHLQHHKHVLFDSPGRDMNKEAQDAHELLRSPMFIWWREWTETLWLKQLPYVTASRATLHLMFAGVPALVTTAIAAFRLIESELLKLQFPNIDAFVAAFRAEMQALYDTAAFFRCVQSIKGLDMDSMKAMEEGRDVTARIPRLLARALRSPHILMPGSSGLPCPFYGWSHRLLRQSTILHHPDDSLLVSFLPLRLEKELSLLEVQCVYRSQDDGLSLRALYSRCQAAAAKYTRCFVLVKAVDGSVFGVFLPKLPVPSDKVIQADSLDGVTKTDVVLFRLRPYRGQAGYHCVDLQDRSPVLMANSQSLSIASGEQGYAIRLDESLQQGTSSSTKAFDSRVLCGPASREPLAEFTVSEIEILAFGV